MAAALHELFNTEQLRLLHARAGDDLAMRSRLGAALRARGYDAGKPARGLPGVVQRVEYTAGDELKIRPFVKFYADDSGKADILDWVCPPDAPGTTGAKCRVDFDLVMEARRAAAAIERN